MEEKPTHPKSNYCITGLYFYDKRVVRTGEAGEPQRTGGTGDHHLNRLYLEDGAFERKIMGRGFAWLDTGTMDSLTGGGSFVGMSKGGRASKLPYRRKSAIINGWISKKSWPGVRRTYGKSPYGEHLKRVAEGKILYDRSMEK